jgi:hypothetical protein
MNFDEYINLWDQIYLNAGPTGTQGPRFTLILSMKKEWLDFLEDFHCQYIVYRNISMKRIYFYYCINSINIDINNEPMCKHLIKRFLFSIFKKKIEKFIA